MDPLDDAFSAMRVRESLMRGSMPVRHGPSGSRKARRQGSASWLLARAGSPPRRLRNRSRSCQAIANVILDGSTYTLGDDPRSPALNCFDVVPRLVDAPLASEVAAPRPTVVTGCSSTTNSGRGR